MRELALHVLDVVENSLRAGASLVEITVEEDSRADTLVITVRDDGEGMDEETLARALDPFFTTKTTRRVGLGLSLFREAARRTGGELEVRSTRGHGTTVVARFGRSHVDRQPLGDMASTVQAALAQNPRVDIVYLHRVDGEEYLFDTRHLRALLEDVPLNAPEVLSLVGSLIREKRDLT